MSVDPYGAKFFAFNRETSRPAADIVVPMLMELYRPASVVDVGCGSGQWLGCFVEHGVRALGVDWSAGEHVTLDNIETVDLASPFSLGRTFDLAMSLEVAEHLPPERGPGFVDDLAALAPVVVFGGAIPGQRGTGHVNMRPQSYWAALFAEHGYAARDVIRPRIWDDDRVAYWYRQNTIVYEKGDAATDTILDLVHPILLAKRIDTPPLTLGEHLADMPRATKKWVRKLFDR